MVVLSQPNRPLQRKAHMSTAAPTAPINHRTQEGLSLRVRRVAEQIAGFPDNHILGVRYGVPNEIYLAKLDILVDADTAARFRRQTMHRPAESGMHLEEVRKDRLTVTARLLPAMDQLDIEPDWLCIDLVTAFDNEPGDIVMKSKSAAA